MILLICLQFTYLLITCYAIYHYYFDAAPCFFLKLEVDQKIFYDYLFCFC